MTSDTENSRGMQDWDNGPNTWPNVNIKKSSKTKEFYRAAIDFAINNFCNSSQYAERNKITKNMNSFNSELLSTDTFIFDSTGKKKNRVEFVDYNILRSKIDTLLGEFIQTPIKANVRSINSSAITARQRQQYITAGMRVAASQLKKIKSLGLVEPFAGMPIPDEKQENNGARSTFGSLSNKSKNEFIAEKLIQEQLKIKNIKDQFYNDMIHIFLSNNAFGKVELNESTGEVSYRSIDVREKIALESYGDIYQENSPYIGERRKMYLSDILREYPGLFEDPRSIALLRSYAEGAPDSLHYSKDDGNNLLYHVYTIEFKTYEPIYQKETIDDYGNLSYSLMSPDYYENPKRKSKIKNEIKNNKYQVKTIRKEKLDSVTRIGDNIYIYHGEINYIMGDVDNPFKTKYNYTSLQANTVNGKRVSIFDLGVHIKNTYNVVRWLINKELYKAKGMITGYNKLFLPRVNDKQVPVQQALWQMVNDGVVEYDTTGDENLHYSKDGAFLKAQDIGMSKMVPDLISLGYDLERALNNITGIGPDRQGQTQASSTATNAANNIQNSRNVTAPIFYFANRYFENVLVKCVERSKVAISYIKVKEDSASVIIGNEAIGYLTADRNFSKDSYGIYITDGRKEQDLKNIIRPWMEKAINVATLEIPDAVNFELQESLIEGIAVLELGMERMKQYAKEQKDAEAESRINELNQKMQNLTEDREDKQLHEASLKTLEGSIKSGLSSQDAMQQYLLNNQQKQNNIEEIKSQNSSNN